MVRFGSSLSSRRGEAHELTLAQTSNASIVHDFATVDAKLPNQSSLCG
jgi:hypothetical protein